jgi:hypothetical protein
LWEQTDSSAKPINNVPDRHFTVSKPSHVLQIKREMEALSGLLQLVVIAVGEKN